MTTVNRLPTVGGDSNAWGTVLNAYLNEIQSTVVATVKTANYTLVIGDAGGVVEFNAAGAVTLTVPVNASVAFPTGTIIGVLQAGAGQVTIANASVTFRSAGSLVKTRTQWSSVWLRKRGTDEWVISGDLA